jgi:DNA mismatch repair protein MutL
MIRELLDMMGNENEAPGVEQARQALLVMNSCKAAVKANTPLTADEMTLLLRKLQFTGYPMTCPHGRPIIYVLPYRRLIQAFGRSS